MKNSLKWLFLAVVLLWLTGCTHNSEAKVNVVNQSAISIYATLYNTSSKIDPGLTETFTLTWPGRGEMDLSMYAYPAGDSTRVQDTPLVLNDGDNITLNVKF